MNTDNHYFNLEKPEPYGQNHFVVAKSVDHILLVYCPPKKQLDKKNFPAPFKEVEGVAITAEQKVPDILDQDKREMGQRISGIKSQKNSMSAGEFSKRSAEETNSKPESCKIESAGTLFDEETGPVRAEISELKKGHTSGKVHVQRTISLSRPILIGDMNTKKITIRVNSTSSKTEVAGIKKDPAKHTRTVLFFDNDNLIPVHTVNLKANDKRSLSEIISQTDALSSIEYDGPDLIGEFNEELEAERKKVLQTLTTGEQQKDKRKNNPKGPKQKTTTSPASANSLASAKEFRAKQTSDICLSRKGSNVAVESTITLSRPIISDDHKVRNIKIRASATVDSSRPLYMNSRDRLSTWEGNKITVDFYNAANGSKINSTSYTFGDEKTVSDLISETFSIPVVSYDGSDILQTIEWAMMNLVKV